MPVDLYLLDSRVAANALAQSPYWADKVGQPWQYVQPTGIYLHLIGRAIDGKSVVVETNLRDGLSLFLLDTRGDDSADKDKPNFAYEDAVRRELGREGQGITAAAAIMPGPAKKRLRVCVHYPQRIPFQHPD